MNPNDPEPESTFSFRMLPLVEFDCSGGQQIDPATRNGAQFVSRVLPPVEFSMAVPHLVLTLRLSEKAETGNAEVLAFDVLNLMTALSEYEKTIGGRGLRLHDKTADGEAITLTLAPILVVEAAERLKQVEELLGTLATRSEKPHNTGTPVLEAISRLEQSPADQCKAALGRREWAIEARIAA